jgi:hypothetical protein
MRFVPHRILRPYAPQNTTKTTTAAKAKTHWSRCPAQWEIACRLDAPQPARGRNAPAVPPLRDWRIGLAAIRPAALNAYILSNPLQKIVHQRSAIMRLE